MVAALEEERGALVAGIDPWLRCARSAATLVVTLNRPERRNALAWEQVTQLGTLLERAAQDTTIRAAVLRGAAGHLSAGGDVKDQAARHGWSAEERVERSRALLNAIEAVWDFPKPLITAIDGIATGAGMGLALMSDIRLAARSARMGFAFVEVGLGPDYGVSHTLPRLIGHGQAARLLYTGTLVSAEEARAIRLVDEVLPDADLHARALELAQGIAAKAPLAVRLAKQGLRRAADVDFGALLRTELQAQFLAMTTDDHLEATRAFVARSSARGEST